MKKKKNYRELGMHKNKSYTYLGIGGNGPQVHAPCDGPKFVHLSVYTACMATAQHTTHSIDDTRSNNNNNNKRIIIMYAIFRHRPE